MKFQNPIIPGFAPDPSVVLVGDTFFLVTSSFHLFPGLPIYASKDLNTWAQIGNAINRPGQVSLNEATTNSFPLDTGDTMVATSGLFAPTIRHDNGRFYIICTNCTSDGDDFQTQNFYVTCDDIWSNQWSDAILFNFNGIDPSLYFDDDGRVYVQGSWRLDRLKQPSCTIKQFEIDIKTGEAISEIREIWPGFARYDSEGPHIYKKDGWYYLLIAEGGTFEHHMLSIARSKEIWGPYMSYENNPILTADGKKEYIQNTGHGELFHDINGAWWAVGLGVRDEHGRSPMGRETFLAPVTWEEGGWPKIEHPQRIFERISPGEKQITPPRHISSAEYVYIRDPVPHDYKISSGYEALSLLPSRSVLSVSHGTATFFGKRQRALDCTATVSMKLKHLTSAESLKAGIAIYKDEFRHGEIYFDFEKRKVRLEVFNQTSLPPFTEYSVTRNVLKIDLKILATSENYTFFYRENVKEPWVSIGSMDGLI